MSWKSSRHVDNKHTNVGKPVQRMYNGSVENEFQYPTKYSNLSNSAVRQLLQENENSAKKEVVWPPPPDDAELMDAFEDRQINSSLLNHKPHHYYLLRKQNKPFSPPPEFMPIRTSPPITQSSIPIYKTQPISKSICGGARMRGDQKWPPPECKEQMAAEERARQELARGLLFRPKKVNRDYRPFFAKNTIPNTYPGYKAPPGTQHYEDGTEYY